MVWSLGFGWVARGRFAREGGVRRRRRKEGDGGAVKPGGYLQGKGGRGVNVGRLYGTLLEMTMQRRSSFGGEGI